MKTLNREEAIKAMANGEVVENIKTGRKYKFECDGILIYSPQGFLWANASGLDSGQYQTVREKKKYWLWCDLQNGEVCKYLADDTRRILNGCTLNDRYSEKIQWSEVEL